jgi:hypothetical protein
MMFASRAGAGACNEAMEWPMVDPSVLDLGIDTGEIFMLQLDRDTEALRLL